MLSRTYFLDNSHFFVPALLPPAVHFFAWTFRNTFKAPSSVIPDPVDLGMGFQSSHGQRQVIREIVVYLTRGARK
jgi:hypothetical protein